MKKVLAALFLIVALTAACTPATSDISPAPSATPSNGAVVMPDDLPPMVLDRAETRGFVVVGDRVVFDLANPGDWTPSVDVDGLLAFDTDGSLAATAVAIGTAVVTMTNGAGESVVFTIKIG